eukprot:scaffold154805_cov28-Tisochrysis_lutea.AAC.1
MTTIFGISESDAKHLVPQVLAVQHKCHGACHLHDGSHAAVEKQPAHFISILAAPPSVIIPHARQETKRPRRTDMPTYVDHKSFNTMTKNPNWSDCRIPQKASRIQANLMDTSGHLANSPSRTPSVCKRHLGAHLPAERVAPLLGRRYECIWRVGARSTWCKRPAVGCRVHPILHCLQQSLWVEASW